MQRCPSASVKRTGGLVMERHAEDVVAIRREVVPDDQPAACAVRRTFNLVTLRNPSCELESCFGGPGGRVTDRQATDLAGRMQIAVHQGWREQLDVRNIVEIRTFGVEWEVLRSIHVKCQQRFN